jgi:hypothetical protein
MRFNKLDLNLLVALDALTELNISRAAEKIHLSQSAMSNALARLREYFDDELLIQVGRRMEATRVPRCCAMRSMTYCGASKGRSRPSRLSSRRSRSGSSASRSRISA